MPPPLNPPRGLRTGGNGADPLRDDGEGVEDEPDGERIGVKLVLRDDESDAEGEIQGALLGTLVILRIFWDFWDCGDEQSKPEFMCKCFTVLY